MNTMDDETAAIMSQQRWSILASLAEGISTAQELAAALKLSIPTITNHLHILEAYGHVKRERLPPKGPGKPTLAYSVARDTLVIAALKQGKAHISTFKPKKSTQFLFNTLFLGDEEDLYFLQKFYYHYEKLIFTTDLMAFLNRQSDGYHFFVIAKDVESIRKQHSNIMIALPDGKERKIVIWSHTLAEVEQGLKNKEPYFIEKVRLAQPFWERGTLFANLKQQLTKEGAR
jgi:DNA-binding transcriptional ArsR family regulator